MAQGDLFKDFMSSGGALNEAYNKGVISLSRMRDIQDEMNEQAKNTAKVRKAMWKADYKGQKITERLASTGKKILEHNKKINEMKKEQLITETELAKIDQKIKSAATGSKYQKALIKQYDATRLTYEKNKASLSLMKKATPFLGKLGDRFSGIGDVLSSLGSIIPIIGGIVSGLMKIGSALFSMLIAPFKKGFELFLKTQSLVGNLAADIGLTSAQSKNLLKDFVGMSIAAMKFGGSMEDVIGIYQKFSEATGKNRAFDAKEIAAIVELGKGTGLGVDGAAALASSFDNIGLSLSKTIKLTDKARNLAARYNVNVTEVMKTYQGLVESLTGIGFGKGLDNLTKLAAKAQAIRFDIVGSTKAFTDTFFEPEKAVEAAARMQTLGGKFAASFGDPMQLAFESMNDPAALANKFADMLKDKAIKGKDGVFSIPPADRKMLKIAAETLGQDYEMAAKSAIEQAKISDKMVALNKAGFSMMGISEDDKPALAALMKMNKDNKYEIQMSDGTSKLLENVTDKNQLNAILANRKKNDEAAQGRMNLMERLENIINRFTLGFTNVFNKIFANMDFDNFLGKIEELGTSLGEVIFPAIEKLLNNKGAISGIFQSILDTATDIVSAITKIWSGDGSFMDKIVGTIGTLVVKLFEVVKPYVQMALGKLLEIVGDVLPKFLGGNKMKNAGLAMQQSAIMNDKTNVIPGLYGGSSPLSGTTPDSGGSFAQGAGLYGKAALGAKNIPGGLLKMALAGKGTLGKGAMKLGAGAMLKRIPILGALASAGFAVNDLLEGDFVGAGLNLASGAANVGNIFLPGVGSAVSMGIDAGNAAREMGAFNDGVIYKDGSYGKFAKGDMVQFIDQAAAERAAMSSGGGVSGSGSISHNGTIIIKSEDGKVVTWDQMYASRDLIGGRIASINEGYKGGFGNYQNSNMSPLQPLIV
jgi:hypothetical protein